MSKDYDETTLGGVVYGTFGDTSKGIRAFGYRHCGRCPVDAPYACSKCRSPVSAHPAETALEVLIENQLIPTMGYLAEQMRLLREAIEKQNNKT